MTANLPVTSTGGTIDRTQGARTYLMLELAEESLAKIGS